MRRAQVRDAERTGRFLASAAGEGLLPTLERLTPDLARLADPDQALVMLVQLAEELGADRVRELLRDPAAAWQLLRLLGGSRALGDWLLTHPEHLDAATDPGPFPGAGAYDERLAAAAVSASGDDAVAALRIAYRRELVAIAARDLASEEPVAVLPEVAAALADLAGAALEGALLIARAETPGGEHVRLAVIGMGKTGGRELNYLSDVDVVYVAGSAGEGSNEGEDSTEETGANEAATRLATNLASVCTRPNREPPLWQVDANLRPEGRQGPLVRTVDSHLAYYRRWAQTWEFQALLKARHVAGDADLAAAYLAGIGPMVWQAAGRDHFVEDARAMRRRVEELVPAGEADRQIKLGRGGLRDVEFTVQLLQLVHGRLAGELRSPTTLDALAALSAGGYVGRDAAAAMADQYRFLRVLEHRIQLWRLQRTHLMPTSAAALRRLARAVGARDGDELLARWRSTRRQVRRLHEELFYRPLLPATAQLSPADVALEPETAVVRLTALGYTDARGALRHIGALTEGVSRRAAIQRQLLPVLLGWFADGADPDGGLLAFRKLSDVLGTTHWYLRLLRDSGVAAERLAQLLSESVYLADLLLRSPESVAWLDRAEELRPRSAEQLRTRIESLVSRRSSAADAAQAVRFVRRRELTRTAMADVLADVDVESTLVISDIADVALAGCLDLARAEATAEAGLDADPAEFLVVAMGRLGGREIGYASDADVLFAFRELGTAGGEETQAWATGVATRLRRFLGDAGREPALEVDVDLRPEGRNGPIVRSLAAFDQYYRRWVQPWERQALLRARYAAGSVALGEEFTALIDPLRYGPPPEPGGLRELRRIKARVEAERLPRGVPTTHHLKLGRGGLADVEWTAQLLALQHAHDVPALRHTGTREVLRAAGEAGLIGPDDAADLIEAWTLASRIRNAIVLGSGRTSGVKVDVFPRDRAEAGKVARLLGYRAGLAADFEQDWFRVARHARTVVERVFYGG
ncbi:bifunctional [glutamine synthetase] adenylyltransferase/[glutamine synthetase]-adenylyl-L-tyrosine phosphorylase [Pseudactinotalea sp. HY158]|uniref:bifunctional [glutamine synthetase] adenylyltransferase/[glutamine synthetase]-adenylyl-L-tyrosine phosphorylase n=1 Tax=Pseudactinotalea sp. HY158 TaxID=2654547 RepID=UPI00129C5D7E|nr:bifunctional [glutamine synthetase] adenylyltransferase/[glutamine synthetase]-adenylyl-L-tyrosine phosphorylase [Pseudactinotalea sp. HY158]QGH70986.1 bifunctional [glutamine synthetase] adenylyltransferase/[glutamine synthetase]-adenylyl-L-tyrosine phosphorylase [Pseudactinotalea sp. HY158]